MKYATVALALFVAVGLCSPHRQMPFEDDDTPKICWRICASEKPECPTGWDPVDFGGCWTCCLAVKDVVPASTKNVIWM
ncbi:hypothetical protein GTA08_BOTSDO03697 [Botryosphaeria dothidea]|uniref:Uncharacterized protein n=1 Tax=Botryosphaeria dothidea TaxID=55169 RepID=A0A8H4N824_9PEZI|nr:hypothetical protein GTA08_BOTSDO14176 [Botryosphaeria dothidea]KAF4308077.1 hypothetical protein GTA08_BOTSDO03697 [Botryosphaeria dothidea]